MAEYMPRIIVEAPVGSSGFPSGVQPVLVLASCRAVALGDDGAVDVREHVVLHLVACRRP